MKQRTQELADCIAIETGKPPQDAMGELANANDYGLTAAIHTRNLDRAMWFAEHVKAGVANII